MIVRLHDYLPLQPQYNKSDSKGWWSFANDPTHRHSYGQIDAEQHDGNATNTHGISCRSRRKFAYSVIESLCNLVGHF
jgi:hypothetical protein